MRLRTLGLWVTTATLVLLACTTDTAIGPSQAVAVYISPAVDTVIVGGAVQLHAVAVDRHGTAFVAPGATWISMTPNVATVSGTGVVTGVTTGSATIQGTLQGKSGTAQVVVTPPPAFQLYTDTVVFVGIPNGPIPAAKTVSIVNFGGGTLSGIVIDSVQYVTGTGGWLTTALSSSTAPDTVTLQPGTTAVAPGSNSAYVFLSAPNALNTPKKILAVFTANVGAAASIAMDSGDGQSATVNAAVAIRPSVIARDQYNNPVGGVSVTFAVTGGGGTVNPATPVTTDVSGRARVTSWTLGTAVGPNTLQATSGSLTGSPVTFSASAVAGAAAQIAKNGGDAQSATVGSAVATAPSVLVTDQFGNPVGGVSVTFAVASGGGSLTGGAATSNASGIATVGSWTLGSTAGPNTLTATATGLTGSPLTFTATGTAGAAATLVVSAGNGQSAAVNTAVATAPAAKVVDAFGNGVAGIGVTFAVTGGGGTVSPTSPIFTDAQGVAPVTSWTLGTIAGANSLTATSGGLAGSPLSFTATATAGAATTIAKDSGDAQTATAGTAVAVPPVVRVTDQFGNPVGGASVTFAVATGGGTVNPTTPVTTDAAGRARVVSWTLGNAAGANSLTASSSGLAGSPLTFTATGTAGVAATIARGTGNAQTDTIGATLATALSVLVTDNLGNPVSGVTVNWAGTGGATPSTASNTTNAGGIASVTLTLGTTAGAQGATATSGSLAGSPVSFSETANHGNASQIAINGGNGQSATAGSAVAIAPSAIVRDRAANAVPGVNVTFAVTGGGGTVNPTTPIATNGSGVAQATSWTLGAVAGANSLSATSAGLTGSPLAFSATGTSGTASAIALNAGNAQSDTIGAHLATPISVKVTDGLGNGVGGVTVTWAGTGGATVALPSSITNGAGIASDTLILGPTSGAQGATATSGSLTGSPVTFTVTATHGNATTIALAGGNSQSDTIGATLATAYTVLVTDRQANPVNGVTVTWGAAGGGSITASSITNGSGIASATRTLGTAVGTQTASATASGLTGSPVGFAATATHGNATTIALNNGNAQTDTIGATLATAYTVLVTDRAANPVNGVTVSWAASGGSITASSLTNGSGIASATRTLGTTAGTQTATATVGGLTGSPVGFTATANHGNATTLAKNGGDGQSATAGTAVPIAPSAIVTDRGGNPVPGINVTFAVTGGGGTVNPTSAIATNGSGIAQVTSWTLGSVAGPNTLGATSSGLTGSPLSFTATGNSGTATTMAMNGGNAQTDTIGATLATQYGVLVTDGINPVGGVAVTWAVTGGGGSITPSSTTNGSGIAVATRVLGTSAGAQTATASVGGLTGSPVTFTATATHGNATTIALNGGNSQTDTIGATLATTYTVLVTDRGANPVNGVTVTWAAVGGSITASSVTNAGGIASATRTLGNTAGAQTASATAGGLAGSPVGFTATATAGNATTIALAGGNSQTDTIGATLPTPYTVLVTDRAANPVGGVGVTWAVSGGGSITPSSSTNGSGIASATRVLGLTAGAQGATATASGLSGSPVAFTATATTGGATTIARSAGNAQTDTIGATLGTALSVLVTDAGGNPKSGITVNWAGTGGAATSGPSSISNGSGLASISLTLGTAAGAQGATATAAGLSGSPVSFSETATAGHATTIALNAGNGQSATVNTNVAVAPAVLVTDRAGNPVSGTAVTFGVTGGGGSVTGATPTTGVNGLATVGSWKLGTAIGTNTLTATSAGLGGSPVGFTATGTADVPFAIAKTQGDLQSATVNTSVALAPTVMVTDQFGNPVSGASVTFLVTAGGGKVNGASSTSVGTDAGGSAAVTWTMGTAAGADSISVSASGAPTVFFSATATADVAKTIALAGGNAQTDTIGATLGTALSVLVTDAFGNPVSGTTVNWAGSGGATPSTASNATNGSGIASVALTFGTTAGSQGATATSAGLTGSPVTFTETAVHGNASQIAINGGNGQSATVGQAVAIAPSAIVRDRANNVVPGVNVTFAVTAGGGTVNPVTAIATNGSGIAQVTSWTLGSVAGTNNDTLSATSAGLTGSPLTYTASANVGSVSASQSTVQAGTATITACLSSCVVGTTASTITVTVKDAFGNVIQGASVSIASNGSGNAFAPSASGTSDASGVYSATFTSTFAQTKTISATAAAIAITSGNPTVTVNPDVVSLTNSLLTRGTATITACSTSCVAGTTASTITATVRDQFSNPISGKTVTPSCSVGTTCTFSPTSGTTNASGVFTSNFNSTLAQAKTIQAAVTGSGTLTTTVGVTVSPAAPSSVTVTNGGFTARVGLGVGTLPTYTVRDAFSNLVTGFSISISSGGGGTPSPTSGTTNGSGQFTLTSWSMGSTGTENSNGTFSNTATLTAGSATGTATDFGFYTYSGDVGPIIGTGSGCDGCHYASWTRANIVNIIQSDAVGYTSCTTGNSPTFLVSASAATNSLIYVKVAGTAGCGNTMPPPSGGLTATQLKIIRSWINNGAPNN